MPYNAWDEYFTHQLPRPFDHVNDTAESWSDRCYFNVHSPDGTMLVTTGYGNNPNTQSAHGYAKVALADGRHWDLDSVRPCTTDRGDLYAGPMRWTCVEPLQRWKLELGPNASGVEWELHYESRAPMWELLPITIRKQGRTIVDMTHIKQPAALHGMGERRWRADLRRRFPRWTRPHVRHPRVGARRLLALVRGGIRGPRHRGVGVGVVRRHGAVRRRRDHVRGRHAVEALRRLRARRDLRRRRQASGARRHRLHRRGRPDVPRDRRFAASRRRRVLRHEPPAAAAGREGRLLRRGTAPTRPTSRRSSPARWPSTS